MKNLRLEIRNLEDEISDGCLNSLDQGLAEQRYIILYRRVESRGDYVFANECRLWYDKFVDRRNRERLL